MTAFNREKYIAEAVESVLDSSYDNFELVIVDDCSDDQTFNIVSQYASKDLRIKLYRNEINLGQFGNRNKAASLARGEYIKYVDSDDILYSHSLEVMVQAMVKFPAAAMGFSYETGVLEKPFPFEIKPVNAYRQHYFRGGLLYVGPIGLIIKKKCFDAVAGFENYGMPGDNHFSLKIAAQFNVVALPRDLFWWRLHINQAFSESGNLINLYNNFYWNKDILESEFCPLPPAERKTALLNNKKVLIRNFIITCIKRPWLIPKIYKMRNYKPIP